MSGLPEEQYARNVLRAGAREYLSLALARYLHADRQQNSVRPWQAGH